MLEPEFSPLIKTALANRSATLRELDRVDAEDSLRDFLHAGWPNIDPAPFKPAWHIDAICEHLEGVTRGHIRNLLINVPPRSTKSTLVSVAWPAWTWAQRIKGPLAGPQVQFLTTSYGASLAVRDSVKCRRLIQSPWYQELWADRFSLTGDQNAKQRFENTQGGYRIATSVGGTLTGEGGDCITADDPNNVIEMESQAVLESTNMWWDEAMSTRLNDPRTGVFVVVMQRLSEVDLSGHILSQTSGDWTHLCLPARYEPKRHCITKLPWQDPRTHDGELLAPDRFDEESLRTLELRLGPFGAAGQLQQSPVPRGGGIIKSDWWNLWPPEGEQFDKLGVPIKTVNYPEMSFIIASLDTALTIKEENDYSALTVWGLWYNHLDMPQLMLMDAWSERLSFHDLVEKTINICQKRKVDRLLVEGKNNGFSVVQEIQRLCVGSGFSAQAEKVKGDKVARAHSCVNVFAPNLNEKGEKLRSGQIWAPDRRWAQAVIDQCMPAGTGIITQRGVIPIEQIIIGDMVLTHKGHWRPVTDTMKRMAPSLVSLSAKSLDKIKLTPDHHVWSAYIGCNSTILKRPCWTHAKDLSTRPITEVIRNGVTRKEAKNTPHDAMMLPTFKVENESTKLDLIDWTYIPDDPRRKLISDDNTITTNHGMAYTVNRQITFNAQSGLLFGLYAAEGSTSNHKMTWSVSWEERYLQELIHQASYDMFGVFPTIDYSEGQRACKLTVSAAIISPLFEGFGRSAHTKIVPSWIWNTPAEFRKAFVEGWALGDGHFSGDTWLVTTVSESLAWHMRLILQSVGIRATINHKKASTNKINGRVVNSRMAYLVRWVHESKNGSCGKDIDGDLAFSVMSKSEIEEETVVYNLAVKDDESYTTVGGCVHNCSSFPKGQHDDLVDSMTQAINHLRRTGLLQTNEARVLDLQARAAPAFGRKQALPYDV